jgi:hypothetical protein
MSNQRSGGLPVAIERVRSQFKEWRAHKGSRGDRIPERLWFAAAEAAQRHGVHAVSRAVGIEHSALRQRVQAARRVVNDAPAFVELENAAGSIGCVVELEKSNGTRMRICVHDGAAVDWSRMKEAFLGA